MVAITALNMDDRLNFYFTYYIMCPTELCQLLLILTLNTENVDTKYPYSLTLKYLIAHGLKTTTLNITDYQWHYYKRSLYTYDQNNTLDDNSKPFHNNQDADMMLLIPNGFNDLSLTGYMSSSFVLDTEMYVIHYMNMKTHDQPHMGWKVGTDYVLMRVVFLQKGYL